MSRIFTLFVLLALFTLACSNKEEASPVVRQDFEDIVEITPDLLEDRYGSRKRFLSSYKEGGLLDKLYSEAIDRDESLKNLQEDLDMLSKMKRDSLSEYYNFKRINDSYYSEANYLLNAVKDSLLREAFRKVVDISKRSYESKILDVALLEKRSNENESSINDLQLILKLVLTQKVIEGYQNKEIPNRQTIDNLVEDQQEILDRLDVEIREQ